MPVRGDAPGSGCRVGCLHRADIGAYREARVLDQEVRRHAREAATGGYATEGAEWDALHPPLTFKAWLEARRSSTPPEDDDAYPPA